MRPHVQYTVRAHLGMGKTLVASIPLLLVSFFLLRSPMCYRRAWFYIFLRYSQPNEAASVNWSGRRRGALKFKGGWTFFSPPPPPLPAGMESQSGANTTLALLFPNLKIIPARKKNEVKCAIVPCTVSKRKHSFFLSQNLLIHEYLIR